VARPHRQEQFLVFLDYQRERQTWQLPLKTNDEHDVRGGKRYAHHQNLLLLLLLPLLLLQLLTATFNEENSDHIDIVQLVDFKFSFVYIWSASRLILTRGGAVHERGVGVHADLTNHRFVTISFFHLAKHAYGRKSISLALSKC